MTSKATARSTALRGIRYAWHVHHDVLIEPLTEPIEVRQEYIRRYKPEHEIETRLRLLKPAVGPLPAAYAKKAWAAYDKKARAAYAKKAWAAYDKKAWAAYEKAWAAYAPEIEALHAIECPDCPWDGSSIFPTEQEAKS